MLTGVAIRLISISPFDGWHFASGNGVMRPKPHSNNCH